MEGQQPKTTPSRANLRAATAAAAKKEVTPKLSKESASLAITGSHDPHSDAGEISCAMIENLDDVSMLAFLGPKVSLLDSGVMSHLIKYREYFQTYDEDTANNVTTANLGVLTTYGSGTCYAIVSYKGKSLRVKFTNCLYSPGAAVNFVLVSWLVSSRITCNFDDQGNIVLSKLGVAFTEGNMTSNRLFTLNPCYPC